MEIKDQINTRFESLRAFCIANWEVADVEKIEKQIREIIEEVSEK